jgi:hypothetical protein
LNESSFEWQQDQITSTASLAASTSSTDAVDVLFT